MKFVHPDDRDAIYERVQRRFQGELIPRMYPYRIVCKNGSVKWVEVNTVFIIHSKTGIKCQSLFNSLIGTKIILT